MHLIVKTEFNECYINLPTTNEMMIILLNEYNQLCFCDIMICFYHIRDAQYGFLCIHFSHTAYISLQYSLLFLYDDSD